MFNQMSSLDSKYLILIPLVLSSERMENSFPIVSTTEQDNYRQLLNSQSYFWKPLLSHKDLISNLSVP